VDDRVVLLVNNPSDAAGLLAGHKGRVVCCDQDYLAEPILVSWDDWSGGHDNYAEYCDPPINPGPPFSHWWMECGMVKLDDGECLLPGDANGDGFVTPGDAQAAFDCYLGDCSGVTSMECADVCPNFPGGDGSVTPADAQGIFNLYMGDPSPCD
jgi:hypothetical protein